MADIDDANAGQLIYLENCRQYGPAEFFPFPVKGGGSDAVIKTASCKVGNLGFVPLSGIQVSKKKT